MDRQSDTHSGRQSDGGPIEQPIVIFLGDDLLDRGLENPALYSSMGFDDQQRFPARSKKGAGDNLTGKGINLNLAARMVQQIWDQCS